MKCDYCPAPALSRSIGLCSDCLEFEHDCNADSLGEAHDASIERTIADRSIQRRSTEDRLLSDFERGFAKITR